MAYKIPLFNLNFDEREARAAYDTIKSGWISTGPKNAELEQMSGMLVQKQFGGLNPFLEGLIFSLSKSGARKI